MIFRVLGPLQVERDGQDVTPSAGKQLVVLASLVLAGGRTASLDRLIDDVWGESPPDSARKSLRVYVARLRDAVGDDVIVTTGAGYRLDPDRSRTDTAELDEVVAAADAAEAAGDLERAARALRAGHGLWRGDPLANVPSAALTERVVPGLVERRLQLVERWCDLEIRLGRAAHVVVELRGLVADHPLREASWILLMRALYATGRQAEALSAYDEVTGILAGQLGVDPAEGLRRTHHAILAGTLDIGAGPRSPDEREEDVPVPVRSTGLPPRQLTAAPTGFVGRDDEVTWMRSALTSGSRPVVVVSGPPGVGKSTLAVTVGHLVEDRFPDGQLFVDLRGFSAEQALRPTDVLPRFLRALGVAGDRVPADEDEQSATFRSLLADRRILVVLDNAATADQVRRLLPGGPGCAVIVTSRNQLPNLIALDGARALQLDVLRPDDAATVLTERSGPTGLAADPDAVTRIAELCGRLPLALRVAGAHLAVRPGESVAGFAAELGRSDRLHLWDGVDRTVGAAFDLSYTALDPATRKVFRRLGLIPGPDFTAAAVTALLGDADVQPHLDALEVASLVQYAGGRYRLHDLAGDYARQRSADDDSAETESARRRIFDWYIRKTDAAVLPWTAELYRLPRVLPSAELVERTPSTWITDELANLTATVTHCAEHGPHRVVWHLADALSHYAVASGNATEFADVVAVAEDLAERHGDARVRATMRLAFGHLQLNRASTEARVDALRRAVATFAELDDVSGSATAWRRLYVVLTQASQHEEALTAAGHARALFEQQGHADAVETMDILQGLTKAEQGRLAEAVTDLSAVDTAGRTRSTKTLARRLAALGIALRRTGRLAEAAEHLERGIELLDEIGPPAGATTYRCELARSLCDAGDYARARPIATAALRTAEAARDRANILETRAVLAELDVRSRPPAEWDAGLVPAVDERAPVDHYLHYRWLDVIGWAHLRRGEHVDAFETAEDALAAARARSLRLATDAALTVKTAALVGLGDLDQAVETGREALRRHRETGYRLREARTLCALGDARRPSDPSDAVESWRRARDVYQAIGSTEATDADRRLATS